MLPTRPPPPMMLTFIGSLPLVPRLCLGTPFREALPRHRNAPGETCSPFSPPVASEAEPRSQCVPRRSLGTRMGEGLRGLQRFHHAVGHDADELLQVTVAELAVAARPGLFQLVALEGVRLRGEVL